MDVSIIIATQNRCDQLDRCLAAVQGISSERDWELVIVDNGSPTRSRARARAGERARGRERERPQ